MFDIPHRIRFLKTYNGDASLKQDCLLTSETNLRWQKILNDFLLSSYHYRKKNKVKNPDISFQKDVIDFSDNDAVAQRIALINYYLSDYFFKEDFDHCYITKCYSSDNFDDFYFVAKVNGFSFPLHLGNKKYRKIFYSKII
ncbi:hypothetical protein [Bartonella krasnovii]|uniref:Uncharacterized protein n=1 Tax=Bartonella krasnovii TaxID=2267275 RepID=A0A5B9D0Q8_9HYPH|nr:hypothetical protein [Bartonella krasnovii]QEE12163.1 hypothetical protein D1092_03945 [Bartonella krasnovii]UNF37724.1 hypothetical protein MNL11_03005 [Bartonella krasnovii]UNF39541.1 hypothetical protein MNL10_03720 [Bartonella krasnovii]UNF42974.1 hypothetical protein MNL08_03885 [Bartonella krasnovii]UNF51085.1 hypothetical protein MNL03_03720 [Bartonella krasnovii]